MAIAEDPAQVHRYTMKANTVAVVTDGTAVLGLGDIGPEAALPVMEGKAVLFKAFGGVDAVPVCLRVSSPTSWWRRCSAWSRCSVASTWRTSPPRTASTWSAG